MSARQFGRQCNVLVTTDAGAALDFSMLRMKFAIKKTDAQSPNTASIRIYNVSKATASRLRKEFTHINLQAGYAPSPGIIFSGNIKQVRLGSENGTDTFVDIAAADGDQGYNEAIVSATLAAGASQRDQIVASARPMAPTGAMVVNGSNGSNVLPRGKVLYGMARDYLRLSAKSLSASWSIQDGVIQFIALTGVLPDQMVVLNSKTGLVGTPEQTGDGIKARCLLNPLLKIGGKVQINEHDIQEAALPDTAKDATVNKPVAIERDGVYRLYVVEHTGDTHGQDWYSDLTCLGVYAANPLNKQVKLNG